MIRATLSAAEIAARFSLSFRFKGNFDVKAARCPPRRQGFLRWIARSFFNSRSRDSIPFRFYRRLGPNVNPDRTILLYSPSETRSASLIHESRSDFIARARSQIDRVMLRKHNRQKKKRKCEGCSLDRWSKLEDFSDGLEETFSSWVTEPVL